METEQSLSAKESLELISDVISKTKDNIKENSYCFILWGWLISSASILYFVISKFTDFQYSFLPFPLLAGIGIILTVRYYLKHKSTNTETYFSYFLYRLWLVLGICFMAVVFINVSQKLPPFTYTMLICGIGTFVSGLVLRFTPLTLGGILFLASAVLTIYVPTEYKVLVQGLVIIPGYLIPGYLLKYSRS
ncbi:MAG TPA: hypothetical protein VNZ45_07620 [Bacteroidia bacterium]|jgi:hypothetical protein|nr:hypothetical protein [Bacteroidia bacterium]